MQVYYVRDRDHVVFDWAEANSHEGIHAFAVVNGDTPKRQERVFLGLVAAEVKMIYTNSSFCLDMLRHLIRDKSLKDVHLYILRGEEWHSLPLDEKGRIIVCVPEFGEDHAMIEKYL
jgi:hypothetical protein